MQINSLDDVRPGDIMISTQSTAPNRILVNLGQLLLREHFRIGKFSAGHAGVVTHHKRLVEAMPSGARERDLRPSDWSPQHIYFRIPEDYTRQHIDVADVARTMIGIPYSFLSYVYLAAYLGGIESESLAKHINRRRGTVPSGMVAHDVYPFHEIGTPVEAICSVLAEQAWTLTGAKVIHGTKPQVVTPGMLTEQLWTRPGVIRGGAGLTVW